METAESIQSLRTILDGWRTLGQSVAFVPTMGNLHAGHLRLAEKARENADRSVVSIFVNPTQFSPGEDLLSYPRTPREDADKLRSAGVDLLFMPQASEIYPEGAVTFVEVPGISEDLCGAFRSGHFRGVATVVCKLFNIVQPDVALFGEKDYQQLVVIRRMVTDLNMPVCIKGIPTVREEGGLAMSSRNGYLTDEERRQAGALYRSLEAAKRRLETGSRDYRRIESAQLESLRKSGFRPDYFAIRRREDLTEPAADERSFVILTAAWLGKARLIDNLPVQL